MNDFERQKLLGILKLALQDAKTMEDFHVRLTLSQADLLFLINLIEEKPEAPEATGPFIIEPIDCSTCGT